ncbi:E3 ubiquitin-protein ligase TRIM36 isoform X2 [Protopterus annectens]|uniref:E3 ubiquitin-protein ligase TRIM36 isoform X2 n=1 Tax=Protopterus annectens TaxID=7888 RepID=UPI001CFBB872|nr:E3 ubiquitin-protein ligase TRIM36 isoform X2 [Protopterus annectens]
MLSEGSSQVTSPAVPIRSIERELMCPVCKELFTHPLILPCQHSVCHKCVKELLFFNLEDSLTDMGSEISLSPGSPRSGRLQSPSTEKLDRLVRSGRKRNSLTPKMTIFPCPGCGHDIDLGERGINGLFRNFTLETIVERYRQAARAATAIMCDLCKPPPQEATKSCLDCKASYCNECFKVHHPWGTPKAQHEYIGPTTNFRPKVLMCPEHESEKVNMYCEMCRRPVCHLCKLGGSHANHRVTSMSVAYKVLKEKLSKSIGFLISKEDQVRTQIRELSTIIEHAELNGVKARDEAHVQFEKLYNILDERKNTIIQTIEESKNSRVEKLRQQLEEYQGMLENSGLVGYAQEVLKETDQSCFVQTAKQLHIRIQKATESLKTFQPSASASFEPFVIEVSNEENLLKNLSFSSGMSSGAVLPGEIQTLQDKIQTLQDKCVPSSVSQLSQSEDFDMLDSKVWDAPVIDESLSRVYNEGFIHWKDPENGPPANHYIVEYKKLDTEEHLPWQTVEAYSSSKVVSDLDTNSKYSFRVKACRDSVYSSYSKEVFFHTPPAPVFNFLFDDKCGYNSERLILNENRDSVESVAGFSLLMGAERIQMGCYTCLDYIIGDTGISKGRHFWAFRIEPHSYLVKAGVASDAKLQEWLHNPRDINSPRYDQDSGHDSGSEDTIFDLSQPSTLITLGMRKLFIPKGSSPASGEQSDRVLPMPACIGVCLDYDKGKVEFYDVASMKCLYERQVDCSGTMYPTFALMGGAGIRLEEVILIKNLEYPDS